MQKQDNRGAFIFIGLGILFILMKGLYSQATNDHLLFITWPVDMIVSLFFGSHSSYSIEEGFFHASMQMKIDKSCSGGNFFIICFLLIAMIWLQRDEGFYSSLKSLFLAIVVAWLSTLVVNVSRIIISVFAIDILGGHIPWVHQVVGGVVYLSSLICIYLYIHTSSLKLQLR